MRPPARTLKPRRLIAIFAVIFGLISLNALAAERSVVINEIMYHPPVDRDELQYIELFNRSPIAVDLSGWSFSKGLEFRFPPGTRIEAGKFLVICHNARAFSAHYKNMTNAIGDFSGRLSHHGEKIELADARGQIVDAVKYDDHAPWPLAADGSGASLERICPDAKSSSAANWAASTLPRLRVPLGTPGKQNDSFSTNLPPEISVVPFSTALPDQPVRLIAEARDPDGVTNVTLLYNVVTNRREGPEMSQPMILEPADSRGQTYSATIPAQPDGTIVRFRVSATDATGTQRLSPSRNDLRPTYSFYCGGNTNNARVPFGFITQLSMSARRAAFRRNSDPRTNAEPARGTTAFVHMPPNSSDIQFFDHVRLQPRVGGFKLHFQKDRPLRQMTDVNIIFESPRYTLAEALGYEVFRMAGVPAEQTGHIRLWADGRLLGYQLLIEQPNKSFLTRHHRNENGNLYKLLWYGRNVVEQHEKKTNLASSHDDLITLINSLVRSSGEKQWQIIQKNFNVEEVAGYFAASSCIENWDGFHNNYFAYHDSEGTGKWEMYPWDLDKTWGDYDGSPPEYDWVEMPLTYGMAGDKSPPADPKSRHNHQGAFGGVSWWRRGGYFSGPLLANLSFRKVFLSRLRDLCETKFTPGNFGPIIDALESKLEPEVKIRASALNESEQEALALFHQHIASLRYQLEHRRAYILRELDKRAR